jgi:CDP-diacylglycerol--glycerol-3-phosphate 3-phosphatidyltransferase
MADPQAVPRPHPNPLPEGGKASLPPPDRPALRLGKVFNLPNQLTTLRLVLSVVLFALIACEHYYTSLALFVLAAGTDWLDGYWARKYGQITTLGRILDPFADKVIICGTFIFLILPKVSTNLAGLRVVVDEPWGLRAWMVVVIVGRELLVTALRSFLEERGSDFSAQMSGKLKMVLQCIAAGACLVFLGLARAPEGVQAVPAWVWWTTVISVWSAVVLTVYSGVGYVLAAVRLLRRATQQ